MTTEAIRLCDIQSPLQLYTIETRALRIYKSQARIYLSRNFYTGTLLTATLKNQQLSQIRQLHLRRKTIHDTFTKHYPMWILHRS